jgi:hypothetical protein
LQLAAECRAAVTYCLPVLADDGRLRFAPWTPGAPLLANRHGIPEPAVPATTLLEPADMAMVVVPLVAFDTHGNRLGHGRWAGTTAASPSASRARRRRCWSAGFARAAGRPAAVRGVGRAARCGLSPSRPSCGRRATGNRHDAAQALLADEVRARRVLDRRSARAVGAEPWTGVRNYQARNFMRDGMKPATACCSTTRTADGAGHRRHRRGRQRGLSRPDPVRSRSSSYYDPKATPESPRWFMVDVRFVRKLSRPVTLDD